MCVRGAAQDGKEQLEWRQRWRRAGGEVGVSVLYVAGFESGVVRNTHKKLLSCLGLSFFYVAPPFSLAAKNNNNNNNDGRCRI